VLALTDHDTMEGAPRMALRQEAGIEFIPVPGNAELADTNCIYKLLSGSIHPNSWWNVSISSVARIAFRDGATHQSAQYS
jgi:hypothetical protein